LAVTVVATSVALHFGTVAHAGTELAVEIVALAGFGVIFLIERRTPFLTFRLVWAGAVALIAVAVILPPQGSRDIWSYASYGRMVAVHKVNPYVHRPSEYPTDPAVKRMSPGWRHARSVYGPGFTGVSAAAMGVAGPSALPERLFFQLLAAGALVGALVLLQWSRAGPAALAVIGLNPAVIEIVGGGHNDLLVGAAILAGVVAVRRNRPATAGVLLALGVLVKASGLVPLIAVVAWMAARHGWRPAARAALAGGAVVATGYALVGGTTALDPLKAAATYRSRASLWDQPASWVARHLGMAPLRATGLTTAAGLAVAAIVVVFVAARLRDADPAVIAGGAALVYLLGAAYVLPWYAGWALPVLAMAWRSRLAMVAMIQASVLLLVYIDRPGLAPDVLHHTLRAIGTIVVPVGELLGLVALIGVSVWRLRAVLRRDGVTAARPAVG
jgi:alpha-1,6-mannosyltransferase